MLTIKSSIYPHRWNNNGKKKKKGIILYGITGFYLYLKVLGAERINSRDSRLRLPLRQCPSDCSAPPKEEVSTSRLWFKLPLLVNDQALYRKSS